MIHGDRRVVAPVARHAGSQRSYSRRAASYAFHNAVVRSFGGKVTARVFSGDLPRGMARKLAVAARRKLAAIDAAEGLADLRVPPGNRLEALRGDRAGQHGIRINGQWRIVVVWREDGAHEVEIIDYH